LTVPSLKEPFDDFMIPTLFQTRARKDTANFSLENSINWRKKLQFNCWNHPMFWVPGYLKNVGFGLLSV